MSWKIYRQVEKDGLVGLWIGSSECRTGHREGMRSAVANGSGVWAQLNRGDEERGEQERKRNEKEKFMSHAGSRSSRCGCRWIRAEANMDE